MVHPALAAISIGVGIGVALWVFLVNRIESHSYDHHSQETHRNQPREPQSSGSRNRTDTEYVYCVVQKHLNPHKKFNNLFYSIFYDSIQRRM